MVKLNKILYKSRVTELGALAMEIVEAYEQNYVANDLYLPDIISDLKTETANLITSINHIKAESGLGLKDKARDDKVRAFYFLIFGYLHHPNKNIRTAAEIINKLFKHYGIEIIKKSYASETSLINSLLEKMSDPKIIEAIEKLNGARELINELSAIQLEFEQAAMVFLEEKAKEKTIKSATSIKPNLLKIINGKLIVYLRGMFVVDEAKYGQLTRSIAQMIRDNNSDVKKRLKISEAK